MTFLPFKRAPAGAYPPGRATHYSLQFSVSGPAMGSAGVWPTGN
ncbi:hypothetical protein [uncultured Parolsenella sp.]|nr:hypothetical protein [uncultured Parolsenella sp.]